jgi:hypothetical protein
MSQQWIVEAFSTKANQSQRQFNLENMQGPRDQAEALLWAQGFALRLNQEQSLGATDWEARVSYQQVGIDTLINHLNNLPVHRD